MNKKSMFLISNTVVLNSYRAIVQHSILNLLHPLKGATKLYFMYYSGVVIVLISMGLYKSAFLPTCLVKLGFCLSVF